MSKKDIVVAVDIDGTLNDIMLPFINKVYDLGFKYNYKYCSSYDMEKGIVNATPGEQQNIKKYIFDDPDFWLDLPMADNAYEGLYYLNSTYRTFIVTLPWNEDNKKVKSIWVRRNFPFFDIRNIIFLKEKWTLPIDVIIEDKIETIEECAKQGIKTICKVQPYNKTSNPDAFMYDWKDIYDVMEGIQIHQ